MHYVYTPFPEPSKRSQFIADRRQEAEALRDRTKFVSITTNIIKFDTRADEQELLANTPHLCFITYNFDVPYDYNPTSYTLVFTSHHQTLSLSEAKLRALVPPRFHKPPVLTADQVPTPPPISRAGSLPPHFTPQVSSATATIPPAVTTATSEDAATKRLRANQDQPPQQLNPHFAQLPLEWLYDPSSHDHDFANRFYPPTDSISAIAGFEAARVVVKTEFPEHYKAFIDILIATISSTGTPNDVNEAFNQFLNSNADPPQSQLGA